MANISRTMAAWVKCCLVCMILPVYTVLLVGVIGLFTSTTTFQKTVRAWAKFILWGASIRIAISDADKQRLHQFGSHIVIANHQSHLDSLILWSILPGQNIVSFAAKKELFTIPIFGQGLKHAGAIYIDRSRGQHAMQLLRDSMLQSNMSRALVMFPEATRNVSGQLLPFKSGAFRLAQELELPILPLCLLGTDQLMPPGTRLPHAGVVKVKVLPVLTQAKVANGDAGSLALETRAKMETFLQTTAA